MSDIPEKFMTAAAETLGNNWPPESGSVAWLAYRLRIARALMAAANEADEAATKRAVEWRPIGTAPRDATVLVAVEATAKNMTFFGRPSQSHPAYIDDSGRVCDAGTWKPDAGLNGEFWRASHWMPLPDPPAILKGEA